MRRSLSSVLRSGLIIVTVVLALSACQRSFNDPASAQCPTPAVALEQPVDLAIHREVVVHFTCEGAMLTGTLYLPETGDIHPAVVWILGGEQTDRLRYGDLVAAFTQGGVGFFSYDKRGGGQSQGTCCPGDYGHFNLLTADAVGAVNALRSSSSVDPRLIGFVGTSQAGWIVPRAAVESQVAFLALASAAILPYDQVKAYAELTGGSDSDKPFPSKEQIARRLQDARSSGADPKPYLEQLRIPGALAVWHRRPRGPSRPEYRAPNRPQGPRHGLHRRHHPGAGHGLLDFPPTDPRAPTTFVEWIRNRVHTQGS